MYVGTQVSDSRRPRKINNFGVPNLLRDAEDFPKKGPKIVISDATLKMRGRSGRRVPQAPGESPGGLSSRWGVDKEGFGGSRD